MRGKIAAGRLFDPPRQLGSGLCPPCDLELRRVLFSPGGWQVGPILAKTRGQRPPAPVRGWPSRGMHSRHQRVLSETAAAGREIVIQQQVRLFFALSEWQDDVAEQVLG